MGNGRALDKTLTPICLGSAGRAKDYTRDSKRQAVGKVELRHNAGKNNHRLLLVGISTIFRSANTRPISDRLFAVRKVNQTSQVYGELARA